MAGITLEKGKSIYEYGQPMTVLHLITNGRVKVSYPGGSYTLGKGDVIGICEICSEIHFLSYLALEDTSILTYTLNNVESLEDMLQKRSDLARLFLLSAFYQLNHLLDQCSLSELSCSNLYQNLLEDYEKYNSLCARYRIPPRALEGMESLTAYLGEEAPDIWLNSFYLGLQHIYTGEHYKPLVQEPGISLGFLRKCSLDFRKTYFGLDEQFHYRKQLTDIYFNENANDIFDLYTSLYYKLGPDCADTESVLSDINRMISQFESDPCLDAQMVEKRIQSFRKNLSLMKEPAAKKDEAATDTSLMQELAGSLNTILDFAGSDLELCSSFRQHVHSYKALPDKNSMEDECCSLRRKLTEEFNALYSLLFQRTLETSSVPKAVKMFLAFGYVDEELAGAENCALLYRLSETRTDRSEFGVYTFYDWLLAIFQGKKEPSRNEFDQDYSDYIHRQKASGNITEAEFKDLENNSMGKVNYELRNLFPPVNKMTFGRIATFCPIFISDNVLKDLNDSYVTLTKVGKAFEAIKKVDYSAFYRESLDYDHLDIMGKEPIHLEFLPDIILMPNVGIRGVMWQEIEGKYRNSSGRMFFSIFHMEDFVTSMIRLTGEFRWELCKRIQGARWNDISDRSLTSEYFDYIQFYRKNHELSNEAKEKVRSSLQRAKNSFKEMFVRDYITWIIFEGSGSPRLNKIARRILFTYCPFPADLMKTVSQNPFFSELMNRHRITTAQRLHHVDMLIKKIQNTGSPVPDTLVHERQFIEGTVSK